MSRRFLSELQDISQSASQHNLYQVGAAVEWDCEKYYIRRFISPYKVEIEVADFPLAVTEVIPIQSLKQWRGV